MNRYSIEDVERQIRDKIRKQMRYFMEVEQFEPLPDDAWDELPPVKPVPQEYDMYSDYPDYFNSNKDKLN